MKQIYFACGCFWGAQHFFSGVDGVRSAVCGYANGNSDIAPSYKEVYTDTTGFAETVRVDYDVKRISLGELLELFSTIIDPLSLNRQGEDCGTRYRTGIYYKDKEDAAVAGEFLSSLGVRLGAAPVVELCPLKSFFPAEEYHQDYLVKNPDGYCHIPLKTFAYPRLWQDLKLMLGDEGDSVARMANICALVSERMHFFWTGFYRVSGEELVLGPFQGPSACFRIRYGRGVCGTAWKERRTVVVPDVEAFPGHIACSSLSRSEIVVPVYSGNEITAVLDIDSTDLSTFDDTDALWLGKIAALV